MHTYEEKLAAFGRLLRVMDDLREKCPWDHKQTNESLRANTIEETYELCDAILNKDNEGICEELGDVTMHMVFYALIAQEQGFFDIADVCNRVCDKLIFRHPHVYPPAGERQSSADSVEKVLDQWERIKQKEKKGHKTVLGGVPQSLPALIKAYRIQDKARHVGFDWEKREDVWDKVKEEIAEFEAEVETLDKQKAEEEFGDVLFSLINAARLYHINPDNALEHTNRKFIRRFNFLEATAKQQGLSLSEMTLDEMDRIWEQAKKQERQDTQSNNPE
ncbi:MAG: nucleoside triphosphate pyrophosphohydrolase [Bacteroidaceae bacterium]|nr:nucleoside triphosphate pyrophosphohydrolase [Bacteroidaceae bacterium]